LRLFIRESARVKPRNNFEDKKVQTILGVIQETAMKTIVLLFTLSLLVISSGVSAANSAVQPGTETQPGFERTEDLSIGAAPVSFAGTWKTLAGGKYPYTVILEQIGNDVTGSYSPGNGEIFAGVVTDNQLTFKWTQDGGNAGTGVFIMNEDGKGFTGSSTALRPKEFTVTWNTYIPPVTSFAGTWETITNAQHHLVLTMVQTGTKVTGIYPRGNGKIEGTVSGRVLRFKWESEGGTGTGRFVMDESAKAFSGTYNKGDNPDDVDNTWNGKRPEVEDAKVPAKVTPPPISFTGVWKVVSGTMAIKLKLQQSGNQVTGVVQTDGVGAVLSIREGIVVANRLRLKLEQADDKVFRGELVMDAGGKSFKGDIDGVATSGTLNTGDNLDDVEATGKQPANSGDKAPEKDTPLPISFTGAWHAKFGEGVLELILQQDGDQVTGQLKANSADLGIIREGTVVGNTLRFKLFRPNPLTGIHDTYVGTGELVMDDGGKLFTGHVLGTATSGGTFIGR
jgi:hypothetical protein